MPITIEPIRLQAPSTNIVQDYEFADMGATQACLIWAAIAGDGTDADHAKFSQGMWDTSSVRCITTCMEHGVTVASANASRATNSSTRAVQIMHDNDNSVDRWATISAAPGGNGIRLTWFGTESAAYSPWVVVTLINGINGAKQGALTFNDTDDAVATATSLGITPKAIFGMACNQNAGDGPSSGNVCCTGFAIDNGSGYEQYSINSAASDNSSPSAGYMYLASDGGPAPGIAGAYSGPTLRALGEITSMSSGEFDMTTRYVVDTSLAANTDLFYLALDFDEDVTTFSTSTPTTAVDYVPLTGGSFTPGAVMMLVPYEDDLDDNRVSGNGVLFYGLYVASENAEAEISFCYEDGLSAANSDTSGRTDDHLYSQESHAAMQFEAGSPIFAPGSITYDKDDPLFNPSTLADSPMFGIAFAALSFRPSLRSSSNAVVSDGVNVTNHPTTLPATILAGDLLIGIWDYDGGSTGSWDQASAGTWTELQTEIDSAHSQFIYAKVADGTEDSVVLTHTVTDQQSSYIYLAIQDWEGTLAGVEAGTAAVDGTGTDANPNPPSITPSWGSDDNLIIAICGSDGNATTTVFPYADNNISNDPVSSGSATTAVCMDQLTSSPTDPGTFTLSAAAEWIAQTIVVKPAGVGINTSIYVPTGPIR